MGTIQKTGKLPEWIDSFVNVFSSTQHQRELEHEAEINVKSLPKVVWNDNTFYVSLDKEESCADVFNTYGNIATTLKNVSSIEDVEKSLNKKIVAANEGSSQPQKKQSTLDDELPKVAKQLGLDANASIQEIENTATKKLVEDSQEDKEYILSTRLTTIIKKADRTQKELNAYKKKFTKLAESFNQLSTIVNNLADQMYARTNPGNIYDIGAEQAEVNHFNETANNTAKGLLIEHSVDLTSPQGRMSLQDRILNDINSIQLPMDFVKEVGKEAPVEQEQIKPVELVEEELPKDVSKTDNQESVNINVKVELPKDTFKTEESETDDKILGKSAALFKQQICPICHEKQLRLSTKTASVQDVICKKCNTRFGVDLSTEEIFKKKEG